MQKGTATRKMRAKRNLSPMARTYVNADAVLAQSAERMATRPKYMVLKCQGYEIEIGRSGSPTRNKIVYFIFGKRFLVNSVPRVRGLQTSDVEVEAK